MGKRASGAAHHAGDVATERGRKLGTERFKSVGRSVPPPAVSPAPGRTMRSRGLPVRMRHRIAVWLMQSVPLNVRNEWALSLGLSTVRIRNAVTDARCEGAPITAEMILFLPEPYRSGLLGVLSEWGNAIERGDL